MPHRAGDRVRHEAAQPAQGTIQHGIAKFLDEGQVELAVLPRYHAVHDLHAARGTDATRRAFPAGLDGAELHCVARHPGHIDAVVENDDAAVAEQGLDVRERFVVERRVELRLRQVRAERTAT